MFRQGEVDDWRKQNEPRDIVFGHITHRAEVLREEIARNHQLRVELLSCDLCNVAASAPPQVAAVKCFVCGRLCCLPHALHWLRNNKAISEEPDVACDDCHGRYHPPTW